MFLFANTRWKQTSPPPLQVSRRPEHTESTSSQASEKHPVSMTSRLLRQGDLSVLCPRSQVVDIVVQRIEKQRFVLVRGTPASGKSVLSDLITVKLEDSGWNVNQIEWGLPSDVKSERDTKIWVEEQYNLPVFAQKPSAKTLIIIDEATSTFGNAYIWNIWLKRIHETERYFMLLFASYGSAGKNPSEVHVGTPVRLNKQQRITMSWMGEPPVGLLMTKEEVQDSLQRLCRKEGNRITLDDELIYSIATMTCGHAGAIEGMFEIIKQNQDLLELRRRRQNSLITLSDFKDTFYSTPHAKKLSDSLTECRFGRGLLSRDNLRDKTKANVVEAVLRNHFSNREQSEQEMIAELNTNHASAEEYATAVNWLYKEGFLHKALLNQGSEVQTLTFPSDLHAWLAQMAIVGHIDSPELSFRDPVALAIVLVKNFRPSRFSLSIRDITASISAAQRRPCEDHYCHEFYWSISKVLDHDWVLSPQFGDKHRAGGGALDFYIPALKWGFECIKDGDDIPGHYNRFLSGPYKRWIDSGDLLDFAVLDFRTSKPQGRYKDFSAVDFPKLIHFHFTNSFRDVMVFNNTANEIDSFRLLET